MDEMNKDYSEGEGNASTPVINGSVGMDEMNKNTFQGEGNASTPSNIASQNDILSDTDDETIETLAELFNEGGALRGERIEIEKHIKSPKLRKKNELKRGDIRHYFLKKEGDGHTDKGYGPWSLGREKVLRKQAEGAPFNEAIKARCQATRLWRINSSAKNDTKTCKNLNEDQGNAIPLQDFTSKPVLIGGDAVALYPSMDIIGTTELVAKAVADSKVEFKNINLKYLTIYLFLVLGGDVMRENGLGEYIPKRIRWKESKAKALSSKINREMENWSVQLDEITWQEERMLVTLLIKVSLLALMDSTCYAFGGKIFKQLWGAGIGLRASACMAKIVMGLVDKMWANTQMTWSLKVYMYFRYIDDLRIFLHPISEGWTWGDTGWEYTGRSDGRSAIERTKQEIAKSLNDVTDFIQFTTEGEEDFVDLFLPTLDFQTQVQESGKILFKFFSKPMANNITIQYGTGLAKNVIFSALRQELVRRMLNSSVELDWEERLHIVSDFVQLLINSGHRYPFIKSVTLQAITKYKYMLRRAQLDPENEKFRPLYRPRTYEQIIRQVTKMTEGTTWYKNVNSYDKYKNEWKAELNLNEGKKKRWRKKRQKIYAEKKIKNNKDVICAMFVPPSVNSLLLRSIEAAEADLESKMDWNIKIIEQSGMPLSLCLIPKFPLINGCPKGVSCEVCGNTAIKCSKRGVIYKASCVWCDSKHEDMNIVNNCTNDPLLLQEYDLTAERTPMAPMNGKVTVAPNDDVERPVGVNGMNNVPEMGGVVNVAGVSGETLHNRTCQGDAKTGAVGMNGMNNMVGMGGGG